MSSASVSLGALRPFSGPEARRTHAKLTPYGRRVSDFLPPFSRIQAKKISNKEFRTATVGTNPRQNDNFAKTAASIEELKKRLTEVEQKVVEKSTGRQEQRKKDARALRKKLTEEQKVALDKDILHAGSVKALETLLGKGADVESRNEYNNTLLAHSAKRGQTKEIYALLVWGAQINSRGEKGNAALMIACDEGHLETVKTLIGHGAAIDARGSKDFTALMLAARDGYPQICYELIRQVADIDAQAENGRTPLMFASAHDHFSVVTLLMDCGADLNQEDENGRTALRIARERSYNSIVVKVLEAKGAKDVLGQIL